MGSSASKAIKPLPSKLSRTPVGELLPSARIVPPSIPSTTESKNAAMKADGQDPNYMSNLNSLGAVWVPPRPNLFRSGNNKMLDILKKRAASELAADLPTPNRISAQSLSNLLDDRKSAKSRQDVVSLIKEYGVDMDVELLEELGKHMNAPSVSSVKSLREDTEEIQMAKWFDPPAFTTQREIASSTPI